MCNDQINTYLYEAEDISHCTPSYQSNKRFPLLKLGWIYDVDQRIGMNHHYKMCHFDKQDNTPGVCKRMMSKPIPDDAMLR